jgi:hypothetical protein
MIPVSLTPHAPIQQSNSTLARRIILVGVIKKEQNILFPFVNPRWRQKERRRNAGSDRSSNKEDQWRALVVDVFKSIGRFSGGGGGVVVVESIWHAGKWGWWWS